MSISNVREYFKGSEVESKIQEFEVSSATVELAAIALNTKPERIAKSMSFKVPEGVIIIVMAGDVKIDNAKYKQEYHAKATMLTFEEVEPLTGHMVGGVCPFAIKEGVKVYLDESLKRFTTVFPACGSANSAIELTISELEKYSQNFVKWVDVTKPKVEVQ